MPGQPYDATMEPRQSDDREACGLGQALYRCGYLIELDGFYCGRTISSGMHEILRVAMAAMVRSRVRVSGTDRTILRTSSSRYPGVPFDDG